MGWVVHTILPVNWPWAKTLQIALAVGRRPQFHNVVPVGAGLSVAVVVWVVGVGSCPPGEGMNCKIS